MRLDLTSRTFRCPLSFREMDVRQLSALVAIADHGTFSAAARALFTVQSNVSTHIARLERELGTTLVDRAQGGLTDDGARVVERARRILREMDEIAADVAPVDGQVTGDVRIGILGTTARWLLPHLLPALETRHPERAGDRLRGQHVGADPGPADRAGSARAIIHLPVDDPELTIEPLFAEDLAARRPRRAPARRPRRAAAGRGGRPTACCCRPPGSALRRVLDRAAGSVGVQLQAQAEIDGVRLLASLAVDGHGAAIVPATAVPHGDRPLRRRARAGAAAARRRPRPPAPPGAGPADPRPVRRAARRARDVPRRPSPACASAPSAFPLSRPLS